MVTDLDEGLDLAALGQLLRTHTLRYLEGVTLDAGNDSMGVGALLGALVELLDDDDLLARLAAGQHDGNLNTSDLPFNPPQTQVPRVIVPHLSGLVYYGKGLNIGVVSKDGAGSPLTIS